MAELTPMMKQYLEIKKNNPDSILFFRLGDFYEMFADDAKLASRELDLTLTTRDRHNMDYRVLAAIEAKAFRYALTGDAAYAREALAAIKNYIRTLDIPEGVLPDECRAYGYVIYIAACVYDWCYDTLTPQDREQLVAGCETFLAPHLEVEMPPRARAPSPATAPRPRFSGTVPGHRGL